MKESKTNIEPKDANCFPIYYLNDCVISMVEELKSIGIEALIADGLGKRIRFEDLNGQISDIAFLDLSDRIHLSAAYCQFLWSICFVALRMYDGIKVQNELERLNSNERTQYFEELEKYKETDTIEELRQYVDWEKCTKICYSVFESGIEIINNKIDSFDKYYTLPNATESNQGKVNAIYCYAIVFILNHEISHFGLKHPYNVSKSQEEEADSSAFWTLYSDIEVSKKISAMIGTLAALCSLMFFNESLNGDDQHPDEDKRVLSALSLIKDEYPHYLGFVIKLFEMWGYYFSYEEYFTKIRSESTNSEDYFNKILIFFENKKQSNH